MLDVNVATLKRQGKAVDDAELDAMADGAARSGTIARPTSATPPPAAGSTRSSTRSKPATSSSRPSTWPRGRGCQGFPLGVFQV